MIIVRGAGDLASGIIYKLHKSGFKVIATEIEKPTSIRRKVCFSEAIYDGLTKVEDVEAIYCKDLESINDCLNSGKVAVIVDNNLDILKDIKPIAIVDAILAKKNLGTKIDMADIVIGVGPGFTAKTDVHAVVETSRGHDLGRIFYEGKALDDTGKPGLVGGYSVERVFRSPSEGTMENKVKIGDIVKKDQTVFTVNNIEVKAPFNGVIRGLLRDGFTVFKNMKVADIDPREEQVKNCFTISDKARCIAGSVLEAILYLRGGVNG